MTVFIVQRDNHKSFHASGRFGEPETLFSQGCYPDNHETRSSEMVKIARTKLANFDPVSDVVLLNGDPVGIAIVMGILSESHAIIPVLKWDKEAKDYYQVSIDLRTDADFQREIGDNDR